MAQGKGKGKGKPSAVSLSGITSGLDDLDSQSIVNSDVTSVSSIFLNPDNPRTAGKLSIEQVAAIRDGSLTEDNLDNEQQIFLKGLRDLAESISDPKIGLIQPIVVHNIANGFELDAGERRLLSHVLLGLSKIQIIIRPYNDVAGEADGKLSEMTIALNENMQRENLTFKELISALVKMDQLFYSVNAAKLKPKDLGKFIHKSRGQCSKLVTIIQGKAEVLERIEKGEVTSQAQAYNLNINDEFETEIPTNNITPQRNEIELSQASKIPENEIQETQIAEPIVSIGDSTTENNSNIDKEETKVEDKTPILNDTSGPISSTHLNTSVTKSKNPSQVKLGSIQDIHVARLLLKTLMSDNEIEEGNWRKFTFEEAQIEWDYRLQKLADEASK